jgi:hypothetical protein
MISNNYTYQIRPTINSVNLRPTSSRPSLSCSQSFQTSTDPTLTSSGSFKSLKLEHIASHGLLLTWQGSDPSLIPISEHFIKPIYVSKTKSRPQFSWLIKWKPFCPIYSKSYLHPVQDTVPVPDITVKGWTHPPFEGHVDAEGWIWGRGKPFR